MQIASAQINGIEMHYEIDGEGEPLLLLHGGGGSHEDWVHAGRGEFSSEYKLILPDARGHGRSSNLLKRLPIASAPWTPWRCSTISRSSAAEPSASAWAATFCCTWRPCSRRGFKA